MALNFKKIMGLGGLELVGLDVGSSSVKIVQLEKDEHGYCAISAAKVDIDTQTEDKQRLKENTVSAITKCFETANSSTHNAVCGLCGPDIMVRGFSFPQLPSEAIEKAVLFEAQQVCPLDINNSVVDYHLIDSEVEPSEGSNQSVKGILVVATNEAVNNRRQCLTNASVKNVLMDVDGLALLNCLNEYEKVKEGYSVAVLDIGSSFTNVIILGSEGLPFIRDLPHATDAIINQIAQEHGITTETVLKALHGDEDSAEIRAELEGSLKNACRKLISDITETLRYYTLQEASSPIDKIFVCGGFALIKGFADMLDERLSEKVIIFNPFTKIRCKADAKTNELLKDCGPAMAVATGLAMRSI